MAVLHDAGPETQPSPLQRAALRPHTAAVVHRDRTLSYRELDRRANALAARLRESGVSLGDAVGVCVARSPELIVTLVAVLKCGAAYVPFDAGWPTGRLRGIVRDAGCDVVVTDRPELMGTALPDRLVLTVRPSDPASADAVSE